jgi:hypothetical protein
VEAWDICFLMDTVDEANNAANQLWENLKGFNPLLAPCEMFSWDHKRLDILEATNSDVFHDMQAKGILDWVYLVAAGMAVVSVRGHISCLADLEKFKTNCEDQPVWQEEGKHGSLLC